MNAQRACLQQIAAQDGRTCRRGRHYRNHGQGHRHIRTYEFPDMVCKEAVDLIRGRTSKSLR